MAVTGVFSCVSSSAEYPTFAAALSLWKSRSSVKQSQAKAPVASATQCAAADDNDARDSVCEDKEREQGSPSTDDTSNTVVCNENSNTPQCSPISTLTSFSSIGSTSSTSSSSDSSSFGEACNGVNTDCSNSALRSSCVSVKAMGGEDMKSSTRESSAVQQPVRRMASSNTRELPSRISRPCSTRAGGKVNGEVKAADAPRAVLVRQESSRSSIARQQESKGGRLVSARSGKVPTRISKVAARRPPWRP